MIEETWKPVFDSYGFYEISNMGRLRRAKVSPNNWRTYIGKIIKPGRHKLGYCFYTMNIEGERIIQSVHRIVCNAFLGKRPVGKQINHKNGNKSDNRLENLEYVTQSQNGFHSARVLGKNRGIKNGNNKLTEAQVMEIKFSKYKRGILANFSRKFNVSKTLITNIRKNKTWFHINRPH